MPTPQLKLRLLIAAERNERSSSIDFPASLLSSEDIRNSLASWKDDIGDRLTIGFRSEIEQGAEHVEIEWLNQFEEWLINQPG